jgi:type IV secretory pathway VirB2 component (pilin)
MTLIEMRRWTISICVAVAVLLTIWDVIAFLNNSGDNNATISDVLRTLNGNLGGLLALATAAIWIHIFAYQWLPAAWQGE